MGWFTSKDPRRDDVEEGDNVFGKTNPYSGNKGRVLSTGTSIDGNWVEVEWTWGPRSGRVEKLHQHEVSGTSF
jgi:hypothetical protein